MMESTTEDLARFAASVKYENIPAPAREYCKDILLDTLACAFAGHFGEETDQIARFAKSLATSTESTVIGGDNLSLAGATLLNGYLITAVTMCDIHRSTLTHVTPEVVPPALLIGERDNVSGRDLLVALAAGFEVTTRVGVGSDYPAVRKRGYHGPGVFGPFGAAAAVGRLRGLSPEAMARAFGLAGSQAGGTFAAWGTPTVKFHQCRGALSGLMAALLAELGKRWEFEQIALRLWPSASSIQGMNTALFDALEERPFKLKDIKRAQISLTPTVFNLHGKLSKYKAKFDALISAHYTAAVIIEDHALTLDQFLPARYDDPVLRNAAANLIDVQPDESLADVQTVVEFELNDGTKIVKRCNSPRGSADNRLTRAQIESKMRTYAQKRIGKAAIERIIASIWTLEDVGSVRDLMQTMRQEIRAAA